MGSLEHQMMGYDRAITMFSPDGRLLQVEYAKKTVKQGSLSIGIKVKEGIILIADKRVPDKFVIPDSIEKISKIDQHIFCSSSGITSDARILIRQAQVKAQQNRLTYDSSIDTLSLVKEISDLKQLYTQSGGARPFGVSLIIGGVDETGLRLFLTDPTGIYFEYKAIAIGIDANQVMEIFEKEYHESMEINKAMKMGVAALKKVKEEKLNPNYIDLAYITLKDKKIIKLTVEELKKLI